MFDPNAILGGLLQGALRGPSMGRIEHAMGDRGLGGPGGPLGQILGQLGGGGGAPARASDPRHGGRGGGILGELSGLSRSLGSGGRPASGREAAAGGLGSLAEAVLAGRGGGVAGSGGGSGGLGGVLGGVLGGALGGGGHGQRQGAPAGLPGGAAGTGLGSRHMRGAMGAGALALLGMLAMRALRQGGQSQAASAGAQRVADPGGDAMPPDQALSRDAGLLVLKAMIEAAKADGSIDEAERQRILGKLQEDGVDPEEAAFVRRHAEGPPDPAGLAAEVPDQVVAAQVYAASLLAIKVDTQAERAYLRDLAQRLGLDPATVAQLHQALGAPA